MIQVAYGEGYFVGYFIKMSPNFVRVIVQSCTMDNINAQYIRVACFNSSNYSYIANS